MICPLLQVWGDLSIFSLLHSSTYQQAAGSPVSITCAELFTSSSPSPCSPVPDHPVDAGEAALHSASPLLGPHAHGGGPGTHAEARLLAPAGALGQEQPLW